MWTSKGLIQDCKHTYTFFYHPVQMSDTKSSDKGLGLINIAAPPHQGPGLSQQTPPQGLRKKKKRNKPQGSSDYFITGILAKEV